MLVRIDEYLLVQLFTTHTDNNNKQYIIYCAEYYSNKIKHRYSTKFSIIYYVTDTIENTIEYSEKYSIQYTVHNLKS